MHYFLVLIAAILSAFIFDLLSIVRNIHKISSLSKESFAVMKSQEMEDDKKQKVLLSISGKIFLKSLLLIALLLIVCLPFFAIYFIQFISSGDSSVLQVLNSILGIGLTLIGFLLYYGGKKIYERF